MRELTTREKWIIFPPLGIAAIVLFVYVGGQAVKFLWNWLLPPLFGWREVTFWQALGLLALCRILFGRLGGNHSSYSGPPRRSRKERERIRQGMRERFGDAAPRADGGAAGVS